MLKDKLISAVQKSIEDKKLFLIDLVIRGNERNRIIEVYVDGEKNITAEDCAEVSRDINNQIEENNIIDSSYRLDVSSPGVDRPLVYLKQFNKHLNRKFEFEYFSGEDLKKASGKLVRIEGEDLYFLSNKEELLVNFNQLKNAKVVISFS